MLAFIRTNYRVGDNVEITSSEGVFCGAIEFVTEKFIVLRLPNGQVCGIAGTDVRSFRANPPQYANNEEFAAAQLTDTDAVIANQEELTETGLEASEEREKTVGLMEDSAEKAPGINEPKVIGHIDLEALQQIDPKYGHRRYFRSVNNDVDSADKDFNQGTEAKGLQSTGENATNFVPAKGRINYYNAERRYGFIFDFATENSLYFNSHQIADRELYDDLYKGTKVVYSIDRNNQGLAARNVHLPKTFDKVLALAEEHMEAHRLQTAKGLVEHVLEVDNAYDKAQTLLEDINGMAPAPRFVCGMGNNNAAANQFSLNTLYAQAKKAYLNKNFDEAEKYYLEAIEANEKPESCVKDLVMLYVSRYKQNENLEEKEQIRQKAIAFMDKNRGLLTDNLTTKQFLALNYYLPILDFEHFISMVDEILADPQVLNVLSRRVFFIWQKAIAFNKMGRTEEALKLIEEGLELAPRSRQLLGLQHAILHPELCQKTLQQEETDNEYAENDSIAEKEVSMDAETEVAQVNESVEEEKNQMGDTLIAEQETAGLEQNNNSEF